MSIGAIKYLALSAGMVISFALGLKLIFANDMRREYWRSFYKRYIYFSQRRFKLVSSLCGWFLLAVSFLFAYYSIIDLMD